MKTRRNTGGFTLLELALAVAVIGILSGVTAVNVVHYQRTLTQVELDGIAREIFVAAQNHLTMAESQGFMGVADSDWGETYQQETATEPAIYYYVADPQTDRTSLNMLNLMLPFASVDETVRTTGGSYVIRYQKNPALVLDVFYAPTTGRFPHTFTKAEATPQEEDDLWDYCGSDKKQNRSDYGTNHAIIGWYGVDEVAGKWENKTNPDDPVKKGAPLSPPTVKIVNAEQLYVEVTNPNRVDRENPKTSEWYENARLHLEITGVRSGNRLSIELMNNAGFPSDKVYIIPVDDTFYPKTYRVILDDVTQNTTRFYKIMGGAGLYPGEDITICAVSYNNKELTNIATSASSTTNSLFASVSGTTASIANFRHLENLDSDISNISPINVPIAKAKQVSDMDWTKFVDNIKALKREERKPETVEVYSDSTNSDDGYYLPIQNQGKIEYTGELTENGATRAAKISNVQINVSGNAGLFATLGHESTVTDLELVNFSVLSSNGNAGALAGVLQNNSTVQRVLVRHDTDKSGDSYKVTGNDASGGLVGLIDGACTVTQSAAAVYVTSSNGDAGGLIGTISDGASVTVEDSYAGGHTDDGQYNENDCNITATNGNAGGLIGSSAVTSMTSLTVENCYATASVDGKTTAGGLIGDVKGGTITNCYVTGYVNNDSAAGAFAGKASDSTTKFTNDRYLSIINGELPKVGNQDPPNVSAFDELLTDYVTYAPCKDDNVSQNALPYDEALKKYYGGNYLFMTISQLHSGQTYTADWMKKHYGDWPMPETRVVNVAS